MNGARSLSDLAAAGALAPAPDPAAAARLAAVAERYAVGLTPYVLDRVKDAPYDDPVRVQYIPSEAEAYTTPDERADPIGDAAHSPVKGIVHRYPDRVLLKPLHACAVYCRFCFRREMVGPGGEALTPEELEAALAYVRERPEIWEVIVTGGDPFVLSPRRLRNVVQGIARAEHVAVVRFHTRVPVADPARVTPELVASLRTEGLTAWVAVHVNHPAELTAEATAALARMADAGVPLVSQTVLLRGVNDDADTLDALFRGLVRRRVKPYYLHHPDLAPGTGHFRVPVARGQDIAAALRGRLSGLAQPTYVLDVPGGHGKVPIARCAMETDAEGRRTVTDPTGRKHPYPG